MVTRIVDQFRKATTFLVALVLWAHALFFFGVQFPFVDRFTKLLQFNTSEIVIFINLIVFSLLGASGFWRTVRSVLYIYFFPFVLAARGIYWAFRALRALNNWFLAHAPAQSSTLVKFIPMVPAITQPATTVSSTAKEHSIGEIFRFLLRPFKNFMFLWCLLLLVTQHLPIVWLCLAIVLIQLARKLFFILKILIFSDAWLRKIGPALPIDLHKAFDQLANVSENNPASDELRKLLNQFKLWRSILSFFKDPYLLSRWAWAVTVLILGCTYTYIAVLFSFAYYGIAKVSGVSYAWPEAFTASFFILSYVGDLPHIMVIRILGGVQWLLVPIISIGAILNFLRRKLDGVRQVATELSNRLDDQAVSDKLLLLEEKFSDSEKKANQEPQGGTP